MDTFEANPRAFALGHSRRFRHVRVTSVLRAISEVPVVVFAGSDMMQALHFPARAKARARRGGRQSAGVIGA
jgi:hypothetical protein